jgi:hypothetical protein
MKKRKYLYITVALFTISIAAAVYTVREIGLFSKDKILVRALSCDECADYEVVAGNSKISSQLQAPSDSVNIYQVYLTGDSNPSSQDYTRTYDYYLVKGKLTGLQKAKTGGMIFPVITVYTWEHIVPAYLWMSIILAVLFLIFSIRYFTKFRFANKPDITVAVLKTHSDPPLKKA